VAAGRGQIEKRERIRGNCVGYICVRMFIGYIMIVVPSTSHFRSLLSTSASRHEVIQPLQPLPARHSPTYKVDFFLKALMRPLVLAS
jgi:hypothetical protein